MSRSMRSRPSMRQLVGQQDLQVTHGAFFVVVAAGVAVEPGAAFGDMHT